MKFEDLRDTMRKPDDKPITECGRVGRKKKPPFRQRIGAGLVVLALILTSFLLIRGSEWSVDIAASGVKTLAMPEYPTMHEHPYEEDLLGCSKVDYEVYNKAYKLWNSDVRRLRDQPQGYQDGVMALAREANPLLLTDDEENRIYSPLNIYMALSLLAEMTADDTREEVLGVVGVDTIEELRAKANSLWQAHYMDDGSTTSLLANSVWFDYGLSIKKETMQILQDTYKASAFQGDMGSAAMTDRLQEWLNEQTDNLLESSVDSAAFDENSLMALASTILFRAKWNSEFSKRDTAPGTFHSPAGSVETGFMSESRPNSYYWGDNFAAISKGLTYAGNMWFFLPDEGVRPEELLADPQVDALLEDCSAYDRQKFLIVNFKLPKFDVMSEIALGNALQELGIHKAFTAAADFSPTSEDAQLYLSDAKHAARVMVDEDGVTGAAYTLMLLGAGMPPDETVDFFLDRPFLFVVQGHDGVPLFVGVVNRP